MRTNYVGREYKPCAKQRKFLNKYLWSVYPVQIQGKSLVNKNVNIPVSSLSEDSEES